LENNSINDGNARYQEDKIQKTKEKSLILYHLCLIQNDVPEGQMLSMYSSERERETAMRKWSEGNWKKKEEIHVGCNN
jgi:hypothetical protein